MMKKQQGGIIEAESRARAAQALRADSLLKCKD